MKLFKRKITPEYIRKHYTRRTDITEREIYEIGKLDDMSYYSNVFLEIRNKGICLSRGYGYPFYWVCYIEYIYQLKQMLKIYKIL